MFVARNYHVLKNRKEGWLEIERDEDKKKDEKKQRIDGNKKIIRNEQ